MTSRRFGPLLRQWRTARRMSQERLAAQAEVSTRHISFMENGRSLPSRTMVLVLASALDLPLRDRNLLLGAAGYAAVYRESALGHDESSALRRSLALILRHQDPYPALGLTPLWDVIDMNRAAFRVFSHFLSRTLEPQIASNVMHAIFHPDGLRSCIVNWDQVSEHLVTRLRREAMLETDPPRGHLELWETLQRYPDLPRVLDPDASGFSPDPWLAVHLKRDDVELRFFTTLTTLGTPLDVTAEELRIESYFPADPATDAWLREGRV
jgi:transcriptional regulator with XRE-family HTH domain